MEIQKTSNNQSNLEKEEWNWRNQPCNVGDLGSIPGLERSHGEGRGNPPKYSCLENPHGQRSLAGFSPWGRKQSDMTEPLSTEQVLFNKEVFVYL